MSYLIPYENFYIETKLKPGEVHQRLAIAIRPYRPVLGSWGGKLDKAHLFEGAVAENTFQFRSDDYTRSEVMVPMANGIVVAGSEGSLIHVEIKPTRALLVPYAFGSIMATLMAIAHTFAGFIIFFSIAAFSYPFVMLMFKYQTNGMRTALCQSLEGDIRKK